MASPFWEYFHERLHWPPIFSPGPLAALLKGLALHMDGVRDDILWLRRQWNPATADDDMIAGYGGSRGILRTSYDTDESYRLRVVSAFAWHKLGGKVRGVTRILAENGFSGARILPSLHPDRWAHFRLWLDVTDIPVDQQAAEFIFWLLNEYKPARSVLESLDTGATLPLDERVAVGLPSRTQSAVHLAFSVPESPSARVRTALMLHSRYTAVIALRFPSPRLVQRKRTALCVAAITSSRVGVAHAVQE